MTDWIYPYTSTCEVPTIYDKKTNKWYKDTTSIILMFENNKEISTKSILPQCKVQQFFCFLLEDFFDEWLWRPALFYRWEYKNDSTLLSNIIYNDMQSGKPKQTHFYNEKVERGIMHKFMTIMSNPNAVSYRQYLIYVTNDGIKTQQQKKYICAQYIEILQILNEIFNNTPFLLGNVPTIADYGLFASMFRHFSLDPTPRKIMLNKASNVYEWVARMWNLKKSNVSHDNGYPKQNTLPKTWDKLLFLLKDYFNYLYLNEKNYFKDGNNKFNLDVKALNISTQLIDLEPVKFRVWLRRKLQKRYDEILGSSDKIIVDNLMKKYELYDVFWRNDIENKCDVIYDVEPPLCKPVSISRFQYFLLLLNGTPKWNIKSGYKFLVMVVGGNVLVAMVLLYIVYKIKRRFSK
eukprot:339175_1